MSKRKKVILVAACLLAAVATIVPLTHHPEPRYKGRPLSEWLLLCEKHAVDDKGDYDLVQVGQAITAIGTNALHYLTEWIQQEPPSWPKRLRRWLPRSFWNTRPGRLLTYGL